MCLRFSVMLPVLFCLVLLSACNGRHAENTPAKLDAVTKEEPKLTETYWKLVRLMGEPVKPSQNEAHIILKDHDARVIGSGGCNRLTGGYVLKQPERIRFTQIVSTMMACPSGMDREQEFLETLGRVDSYVIRDGRLQLLRARMAPLAEFEPVYLY
ncbi:MAG: heat-shock protein [Micavibrio aeruginosavorus]|uniref:Heat-shock protein n=1 Tax=Micavibrio aeruginosavorus TaxID=349221 RepID=A0A2W4ZLX7_9BACT|nr:MAG: heat-shock protein [Micavibrio aeruginosavorus]